MNDSPIEAYLDELILADLPPRRLRHLLSETESHLRDAAEQGISEGLSPLAAEVQAIRRFGPARELVAAEKNVRLTDILRQVFTTAAFLGGIGALSVGLSGLIAGLVRAVAGDRALVSATGPLSSSDCARWLAADPGADSCRQAALSDWAAETIWYRIAVGLLGAIVLAALLLLRRRSRLRSWTTLPRGITDAIAASLFVAAAAWTLALGLDAVVRTSGDGSGQWLSAAAVSLAAAAVFGWRVVEDVRATTARP